MAHLQLLNRKVHPFTDLWNREGARLTAEVLLPNGEEGRAKLLDAKGVDYGVDGRIAVGEQDGDVDEEHGLLTAGTEKRQAVEDVQGQPADGEEEENQGQGLGEIQLLAVILAGVVLVGRHLLVQLLVDHVEDLRVDGEHQHEGRQHPAEKVEVDHVLHADDVLKLTGDGQVGPQ